MENQPSVETVLHALNALYRQADAAEKEKASSWLGELQRSVYAWQISDNLLRLNRDLESCYFAAQTMRTKIQFAFHELDASSHMSLRDSLLERGSSLTHDTPHVIMTQLSLALADLILQMTSWAGAVNDLFHRFGSNPVTVPFLMEVLLVIPEELNSHCLKLGENRRADVIGELQGASSMVLEFLDVCSAIPHLQSKVFRCLGNWYSAKAVPDDQLLARGLVSRPFLAMLDPSSSTTLHESAADCICSILYVTEDFNEHHELIATLLNEAVKIADGYHLSVAQEDIDRSINFARVFTEFAETLLLAIVDTPNQGFGSLSLLDMVLTFVGHHQYEVAEITFNFWYRLSEYIYDKNSDELCDIFKQYIHRLIVALCCHCQFDPDYDGIPDDGDDFADFRIKVSELVQDVVFIVGSSSVFRQMFDNLKSESSSWDISEASLFIMSSVAKNILPDENTIVPQVVGAIMSLTDSAHIALRYTGMNLIGELSEWIDNHSDFLDPILRHILLGLQHPLLASASANSLQKICTTCQEKMTAHFRGLLDIAKAIDTLHVSSSAAIGLLKGTSVVLTQLPHQDLTSAMSQLCSVQTDFLNKLLSSQISDGSRNNKDPVIWLDRLSAIFRHTNPNIRNGDHHPCQPVINGIWPVLCQIGNKYQSDIRVIERYCRCIRFAVRCIGKASNTILTPIVVQMVSLYQVHHHSCFLYLGSILIDEYGGEEGYTDGLMDMLKALSNPTFKLFEKENGLRSHPDTVDDWFRLCLRCVQKIPVAYLQSDISPAVFTCAINAVALDHRDANSSVTKYLTDLIKSASSSGDKVEAHVIHNSVIVLLHTHGQSLVSALIHASIFSLATYMIADVADVVYQLMCFNRQLVVTWLETTLKSLPSQNSSNRGTATPAQLNEFHLTISNADNAKVITRAVRELMRFFR